MNKKVLVRTLVAISFATAMVVPAVAADTENILTLTAPKDLSGVPALPFTGEKITFTTPDLLPGTLTTDPIQGTIGEPITITGKGLPANSKILGKLYGFWIQFP